MFCFMLIYYNFKRLLYNFTTLIYNIINIKKCQNKKVLE